MVYFVGGIFFNKYRKGVIGKEMIFNFNFWIDFFLFVKVCKWYLYRSVVNKYLFIENESF